MSKIDKHAMAQTQAQYGDWVPSGLIASIIKAYVSNSSRSLSRSPVTNSVDAVAPAGSSEQPGASTPPRGASGANSHGEQP